jgi:3-deoxy-D-manno-octulosonate 8-phosphate phosphatase (KDO 8-P phosphatase)
MDAPDFSTIKLVGFDVDGVLTDGHIIIDDDGRESKNFHSRDGLGLKILMAAGVEVVIITGRLSRVVEYRAQDLGIAELHQKVADKWPVFEDILRRRGLAPHEAAFCGDDIIDLPILTRVGLAMAPADASPEVKAAAHFVSPADGGRGAARQMVEFLLKGRGHWEDAIARYTR